MPDSPTDDPFADLFGQLPDPRARAIRSSGEDARRGADAGADRVRHRKRPAVRRAAREAAARQGSPEGESARRRAAPGHARRPRHRRSAPLSLGTAAGRTDTRSAARPSTPHPRTAPHRPTVDDPPWIFTSRRFCADIAVQPRREPHRSRPCAHPHRAAAHADADTTLQSLFSGHAEHRRPRCSAAAQEQAQAPHRRLDRARRRGRAARRHRRRRPLGLEHVPAADPQGDGLGRAEGLRRGTRERRGCRHDRRGRHRAADLAVALRRRRHEDPEAFYDYLIKTQQNPPFVPGVFKLQKKMTSEAALAALLDPEEQDGEHRTAARGAHGRRIAADPRRRRPGCRSPTSRRPSPRRRTTA